MSPKELIKRCNIAEEQLWRWMGSKTPNGEIAGELFNLKALAERCVSQGLALPPWLVGRLTEIAKGDYMADLRAGLDEDLAKAKEAYNL